jgi:hypothetical protein
VRKRDPNTVIDRFQTDIDSSLNDWRATRATVGEGGTLAQRASMDAFTRMAVGYERFRSDWHIAAITRDASTFRGTQRHRVTEALRETGRDALIQYIPTTLTLPIHPTLEEVGNVLDAAGANLSIPGVNAWQNLATRHLADPWRAKVLGLTWADGRLTEAVVALRNAAAHQSARSHEALSEALEHLTHPSQTGLRRPDRGVTLTGIPTYLNGSSSGNRRRVEHLHELIRGLTQRLRTP